MVKKQKSNNNPKNSDDKCFQDAITVVLNLKNLVRNPQRMSINKPFIDKYDWK